ncbi:MAG: hypothetical protein QME74_10375 [Candidatus Edwardsbacteria bacterium]|nr:hypothetical protein [Candidatus Edwardsbacteria bacterium]
MEFYYCLISGIRPANLLYALPMFAAGLFFLLILLSLRHAAPWAANLGNTLRYWYLNEILALFFAPFLVWIFAPDEATPVWQRAIALPFALLFIGGFGFLIKIMQLAWAFVLFRCALLYFQRPDAEEQAIGCLQVVLNFFLIALLGAILLNRHHYDYGSLENIAPQYRSREASMLFGFAYYAILGGIGDILPAVPVHAGRIPASETAHPTAVLTADKKNIIP